MAKNINKPTRRCSIGGQAVLEGVMMKGEHAVATAVRTESGEITVESKRVKSAKEKNVFFRLPFVRGVVNLCTQLFEGTKILMRSAEVYGDFVEPSKSDKWIADKLKINPMNILMGFSVVLGIALAIGLFVFLPNFLTGLIFEVPSLASSKLSSLWYSLIEGGIMLTIFICYIVGVSVMKDIRRVFMYHGAEHKTISCYEHELELTPLNAQTMSTQHSRCGTTFMFLVIMVSILVFAFVNWGLDALGWLTDSSILNALIKLASKLLFIPVVAGISYELLKLLAKSDCLIARILRAPGMWLQKLTTKQPTLDMLEVAIVAFNTVLAMDADPSIPERNFEIKVSYAVARKKISEIATFADESDLDWLLVEVTGKKRSELSGLSHISAEQFKSAEVIANKMKNGEPLQYALGNTEFYGIKLAVNPSVLIPRPETELLTERAIQIIKDKTANKADKQNDTVAQMKVRVADVCTGSGAIAVAMAKNTNADVVATDISFSAVEVAKANALTAGVKVEFLTGDLFESLNGKFDVITVNPPYIPTADINSLDNKVKNFEPKLALDGGTDGLSFYLKIAKMIDAYLAADGVFLVEFGVDQTEAITKIFGDFNVEIVKDLSGLDRFAIIGRK